MPRTYPRKINPQTEAMLELNQEYMTYICIDMEEGPETYYPLEDENGCGKWTINPKWVRISLARYGCIENLNYADAEKIKYLQDEVAWVVGFFIELHEWCRVNELPLPEHADPSQWDFIPAKQRNAIIEGLAANNIGVAVDPFDL